MAEGMYRQGSTRLLLTNDESIAPDTGKLGSHLPQPRISVSTCGARWSGLVNPSGLLVFNCSVQLDDVVGTARRRQIMNTYTCLHGETVTTDFADDRFSVDVKGARLCLLAQGLATRQERGASMLNFSSCKS